jgi:hypothetical protein
MLQGATLSSNMELAQAIISIRRQIQQGIKTWADRLA